MRTILVSTLFSNQVLGSWVRHGIGTLGGAAVSAGLITGDDVQTLVGASTVVVSLISSLAKRHFI